MSDPPLIFVVGPTASGKSSLALALAQQFPVELISMDSAQIYRGMDIGTAKPDAAARAAVSHHLVDILDPAESYSAAAFAADARRCIAEIRGRGAWPLLVGGTFLYMRALLRGLHELPPSAPAVRAEIAQSAAAAGWPALHAELAKLDPAAARRIHPNDAQRIGRSLEIVRQAGQSQSRILAISQARPWAGPVLQLALLPADRVALRRDIARRFEHMMAQGLLEEVRALYQRGDLSPELPSMRSVGYRQLWSHLAGETSLDRAVERAIIATGQYAKRQLTWLRSEPALWSLPASPDAAQTAATNAVRTFLQANRA